MAESRAQLGEKPVYSVSTRIIFFVFLSTFLTALVVSWISIHSIHGHLRRQLETGFPAVLQRRVSQLDAWLEAGRDALEQQAQSRHLTTALDPRKVEPRRLAARLQEILNASPHFSGLALLGDDGQLRASAGDIDATALGDGGTGTALLGVQSSTLGPLALARAPLARHAAGPGPTLVAVFSSAGLRNQLWIEPDESPGQILLVNAAGSPLLPGWDEALPSAHSELPGSRLLQIGGDQLVEYTSAEGQHMLGSVEQLTTLDWLVVVAAPFEQVFAPVLSVVTRIFLCDLAIILLFSFLAYKITGAIMQPIEALSEAAARISQGDVEHEIPTPRSNDEIGLLTRTFNDMMRKLRLSQQEIEQDKRRLTEQNEELQRANEVLAQLSITDGLTKLHNHRYFQDHLTREIKRLRRTGEPLSMILVDLDDFKALNDRFGHAAGDEVLMGIAALMNDSVRGSDLLARYGGEEFIIVTPNTNLAGAVAVAEKIRMSVEQASQIVDDSMRPVKVTISLGVAEYDGDRRRFFQAADRALYRAKAEGKNCVIAADAAE